MRNIFTKALYNLEKKEDLVLVVIIKDSGSTPRGKGSVMLVGPLGYITGSIGGGAVEERSVKRALACIAEKCSDVHEYDLSERSQSSIGMVCGGEVTVYFQYMNAVDSKWKEFAVEVLKTMDAGGSGALEIDADNMDMNISVGACHNQAEAIVKIPFEAEERAIVFGAGHIALELVPILNACNFRVTVMDNRQGYATTERFPAAEERITGGFSEVNQYLEVREEDYVVIMTSGHSFDLEIQQQVLDKHPAYVGVVGSKKKTATVNAKLREFGLVNEMINQVHTPIGLDIKAITPAEIAVSIASEMVLERAKKREEKGIFKEKSCPMH